MDIDDKGTRPPDRIKRRPGTCKCCAVLFAVIASFVIAAGLWKSGPWAMSFWHAMRDPHRDFVAANSTDAVNPLLGPHTSFDLGLTVWTRSGRFGDEVAIFSKIVMQDVTLKTKHREVEVDFDLPLETSYDENSDDVRAVVSLLPRLNSFLDGVTLVSSHIPDWLELQPTLDSSLAEQAGQPGSIQRAAIERMAVSVTLLRMSEESEDEDDTGSDDNGLFGQPKPKHPYLRTRCSMYLVNETRPLQQSRYLLAHTTARLKACTGKNGIVNGRFCKPEVYQNIGHWGTMLKFGDEIKYGPYLGAMSHGHYKNLRIPVHTPSEELAKVIKVHFTVALTTLKPIRIGLSEGMPSTEMPSEMYQANDSSDSFAEDHWNLYHGLLIAPIDGTRPWTRVLLGMLSGVFTSGQLILMVLYWYTRRSVTGISVLGTLIGIATEMTGMLADIVHASSLAFSLVSFVIVLPIWYMQLRLVLPFTIAKEGSWTVRRWRWTHRERASMRLDPSLKLALQVLCISLLIHGVGEYCPIHIIKSQLPSSQESSEPWAKILRLVDNAGSLSSIVLQTILCSRTGMFAGRYALAIYFFMGGVLCDRAYHTPLVGHYKSGTGYTLDTLFSNVAMGYVTYQALTLPRVEQDAPDEDE